MWVRVDETSVLDQRRSYNEALFARSSELLISMCEYADGAESENGVGAALLCPSVSGRLSVG